MGRKVTDEELESCLVRLRSIGFYFTDVKLAVAIIEYLKEELLAHRENEGDECPVCVVEDSIEKLQESLRKIYAMANSWTPSGKFEKVLNQPELGYISGEAFVALRESGVKNV